MPAKRPEPNIPEDILEQPIEDQRARSFTDSEGFYEEVCPFLCSVHFLVNASKR